MAHKILALVLPIIISLIVSSSSSRHYTQVPNELVILFDQREAIIPCPCNIRPSANSRSELQISVVTSQAVLKPLTFKYSVSSGKIIGNGPVVVWDYDGLAPGEYQITVEITDASDSTAAKIISKKIKVRESPVCDCPISCPSLIIRSDKKIVKAGDKITFHLSLLGGDSIGRSLNYDWKVTDGRIESGQGTAEISIATNVRPSNPEVGVAVSVFGMDPSANCPNLASDSVDFGSQSIASETPSGPVALVLDDKQLVIGCPPYEKGCREQSSPDMIVDVLFESIRLRRGTQFRYQVTGGKIIGNGNRVKWDLTDTPPGSYNIVATELINGKPYWKPLSETVNITKAICICDPTCPVLSINASQKSFAPGDTIDASASISGGSEDRPIIYNWMTSDGEIISGQSSPLIRVNLPTEIKNHKPLITLTIGGLDPRFNCLNQVSREINMRTDR